MFHVTLYGSPGGNATAARKARVDSPFEAMLRHGGFEPIASEPYANRRYIWRKPIDDEALEAAVEAGHMLI